MKRWIALATALGVMCTLGGCGELAEESIYDTTPLTTAVTDRTTTPAVAYPTTPTEFSEEMLASLAREVTFADDDFSSLQATLADTRITYPHEELYNVKQEYERLAALPAYASTHENYFADGVFTADELYRIVKKNNAENPYPKDKQISDADLKHLCEVMAPVLLEEGRAMSASDAALLSEKVDDLRVFVYNEFSNGSYDSATGQMSIAVARKNEAIYEPTIRHETYHMIQAGSMKEHEARGIRARYGFCYEFDEEKDQPLHFRWVSEGAAERMGQTFGGSLSSDVYQDAIRIFNYIKAATMWREDIDETTLERLTLTSDLEGWFDYFDCRTEEQKSEALNLLALINYEYPRQGSNEFFKDRYEETYGQPIPYSEMRLKGDQAMCRVLSREFFKNFTNALKGQTLTLEELFTASTLFEFRIYDITYGSLEQKNEVFEWYCGLQEALFEVVGAKLGMTLEELYEIYNVYYVHAEIAVQDIPLLSEDEAKLLIFATTDTVNERYRSLHELVMRSKT